MSAQEISDEQARLIGKQHGWMLVAFGHPLTCNGGNPDWRTHHDHEVRMLLQDPTHLVCPECGRVQEIPA